MAFRRRRNFSPVREEDEDELEAEEQQPLAEMLLTLRDPTVLGLKEQPPPQQQRDSQVSVAEEMDEDELWSPQPSSHRSITAVEEMSKVSERTSQQRGSTGSMVDERPPKASPIDRSLAPDIRSSQTSQQRGSPMDRSSLAPDIRSSQTSQQRVSAMERSSLAPGIRSSQTSQQRGSAMDISSLAPGIRSSQTRQQRGSAIDISSLAPGIRSSQTSQQRGSAMDISSVAPDIRSSQTSQQRGSAMDISSLAPGIRSSQTSQQRGSAMDISSLAPGIRSSQTSQQRGSAMDTSSVAPDIRSSQSSQQRDSDMDISSVAPDIRSSQISQRDSDMDRPSRATDIRSSQSSEQRDSRTSNYIDDESLEVPRTSTSVRPSSSIRAMQSSMSQSQIETRDDSRSMRLSRVSIQHPYSMTSITEKQEASHQSLYDEPFIQLEKRPSSMLPSLQDSERRFFGLVASGSVAAVTDFLQENHDFNRNCVNFQGMSALHVALKSRSEPMVVFLLEQGLDVGDCALHAIRDDQSRCAELILDSLKSIRPDLEHWGCKNSPDFPDGTTPLLLAAQCGNYEVIGMLLDRGHTIQRPHPADCFCEEVCKLELNRSDGMSVASSRLELYRAVTTPAFLCHSSDDPVLTAFQLCRELRQWALTTIELHEAYLQLAAKVRAFAVDIIASCRSSHEVELILRRRAGSNFVPGHFLFPRLMLAMEYNQKEFVAHPNTQQVLEAAWRGDWYQWRVKSEFWKGLIVIPRIVMLPFIALMCICLPNNKWVKHWKLPVNKLLNDVASYLVFLTLVFFESTASKKTQKRGPPQSGLEPVLVVFVVAHIWRSIRQCVRQGPHCFFSALHNWYDVITQLLFALAFIFWLTAYMDISVNGDADLERKFWAPLDYTLLAEGWFTVATTLAFGRLLLLCQLNYHLGPLQVSLGKMAKDISKYIAIYVIIMVSFCAGMCRLYQYYDGMVQEDEATGIKIMQVSSFVSFEKTLKTLFWALFCMSPVESADVVIVNLPGETEQSTIINHHTFTEVVGYISFALFSVISVIMILNMLLATMTNTFAKVTSNVDIEWTFGRTEVFLGYISQATLPPPFNLIPTAASCASIAKWCQLLVKPVPGKKARFSPYFCCYVEEEEDSDMVKEFPVVMAQLVQRYFRDQKQQLQESPGNNEIDNIRQELAELRLQIQDAVNASGSVENSSTR